VWSDWSLVKVNCLSVRLDEESVIWNSVVNSIVNFRMQIKTSDVDSDVENVASDIEDWSYSLSSDCVIAVVLCKDSSNKDSKSETRISSRSSY